MKPKPTLRHYILFLFILLNLFSQNAKAQMVLIPDSNFRNALISQGFGSCFVGDSIDSSCSLVVSDTSLNLNNKNIYNLTGISAFTNLKRLDCDNNQLSSLSILPNGLTYLDCEINQIASLPLLPSGLQNLFCGINQLHSLPTLPNGLLQLYCCCNQLTSLPSLPNGLQILECQYNQLHSLPALPNGLQSIQCESNKILQLAQLPNSLITLNCNSNQITTLPNLPASIESLDCSSNNLSYLPNLPNSLLILYCNNDSLFSLPTLSAFLHELTCWGNHLTTLPILPNTLTYLDCGNNPLQSLSSLPTSLVTLRCSGSGLFSIPGLPITLTFLDCSLNPITSIPSLPNSLLDIYCQYTSITSLPDLPDSVNKLYCNLNPSLTCLPELKKINYLYFDSLNITCLPNYGKVYHSSPSLANVPLCGFFNPNACNIYWNISGSSYFDADTNCIYNSGDNRLSNYNIKLFKNGVLNQQAFSGGEGYYSFDTDSLTAYQTVIDTTGIPFNVRCPQSLTYNDTLVVNDTLKYNRDFALECKPGFDLAAWSITTHGMVPGHIATINNSVGDYSNLFGGKCASGIGGIVSIIYNGSVHYVSPASGALTPTNISGDTLTYTVADFGLVNASTAFNFLMSVDTTAQIGSQVCINVAVSPAVDNNPANNTTSHCFTVHSSFDPNEKEVSPQSNLDINGDRWLTYTINFQNTGTAPAEHIYILDTLNSNLDVSTFQLLAYCKQPYVQILNGGIAKFNFPNINLPDSASDEANSHGYVQYRVKALNNLPAGTPISNTAYIYFDFNTPVVTNTVIDSVINCGLSSQNINAAICEGSQYNFDGLILTTTGNYSRNYLTSFGCDSIVNLSLNVIPTTTNITGTFCSNSSYNFNGQTLTIPGIYFDSLTNILGCDSIVQLDLQQNLSYNDSISQSICYGDAVFFDNNFLAQAGTYTQTLPTIAGCDSITTLTLEVDPVYNINYTQNICFGETFFFDGQTLTQAGVYTQTLATATGCDSITTVTLTIQQQINNSVTQSHDTLTATEINATYQWYDCVSGNLISNATSQNFIPTTSGYYAVILANGNCVDSSLCQYISITGINENNFSEISISPNPSSDEFIISSPQKSKNEIFLKIFDAFGKIILQKQISASKTILKAESWSSGIYFMEITDGEKISVRKLVKE